jgi:hypothetical protein
LTALPSSCVATGSGLLGSVLGSIDTTACQASLGVYGTVNAAVCFTTALLGTFTGESFGTCLNNHLPLCNRCVTNLPPACLAGSGYVGAVCQNALGYFGDVIAAPCFLNGVLNSTITGSLATCLNGVLPFCTVYSTLTQTSGSIAFTSTVVSQVGGLLGIAASPTTYILVNTPTPTPVLPTSFTTFIGPVGGGFTTTVTQTIAGGLFGGGSTTTYVLVEVASQLATLTITSGSLPVRTVTTTSALAAGGSTTFVEVIVPTPLSTSTRTSGSVRFTSTITQLTTVAGGLLAPGTTRAVTTYVLVDVPTA